MKHYRKSNPGNRLIGLNGKLINFERLGDGGLGVLALDETKEEQALIAKSLDDYAGQHLGGVTPITAEEYEALKKNPPQTKVPKSGEPALRIHDLGPLWAEGAAPPAPAPPAEGPAIVAPAEASESAALAAVKARWAAGKSAAGKLAKLGKAKTPAKPPPA